MEEIAVESPMTGLVLEISVSLGESVSPGDLLAVVESMKMENDIVSAHAGTVKAIDVREKQPIGEGDRILSLEVS